MLLVFISNLFSVSKCSVHQTASVLVNVVGGVKDGIPEEVLALKSRVKPCCSFD